MAAQPPRRIYETLDGLRAAGAQLVLVRHLPDLFGGFEVPESFLAVDLFYLVSGVVLANAYGERLRAGQDLKTFTLTRLIRLYPLYVFGLAIGLAAALLNMHQDPHSWWTPSKIGEAIVTGLLFVPLVPGLQANGSSLDGPTWTLLPEIAANLIWARLIRWLKAPLIAAILLISGVGIILAELHWGTLDVGYGPTQQWGALARAVYSFFAGVVIFRLVGQRKTVSAVVPWLCVAALVLALLARPGDQLTAVYEIGAILIGLPLLVTASAQFEPGPRVGKVFAFIGRASWGVYILHEPVARILGATVLKGVVFAPGIAAAIAGISFAVFLTGLSWAIDVWLETPVRKVLTRRLLPRPQKTAPAGSAG